MRDKERILSALLRSIYSGALYGGYKNIERWRQLQDNCISKDFLSIGDLVMACTTRNENEFTVGFVHDLGPTKIREIGSDKICTYQNERFLKLDKSIIGYEILEGTEYKTYRKVKKAFSEFSWGYRFHSISFVGNECTVKGKIVFQDEPSFSFTFKHNSKTTVKEIVSYLEEFSDRAKKEVEKILSE